MPSHPAVRLFAPANLRSGQAPQPHSSSFESAFWLRLRLPPQSRNQSPSIPRQRSIPQAAPRMLAPRLVSSVFWLFFPLGPSSSPLFSSMRFSPPTSWTKMPPPLSSSNPSSPGAKSGLSDTDLPYLPTSPLMTITPLAALFAADAPHETPSIAPQALATRSKSLFVVPCQQATTTRLSPSRTLAESSRLFSRQIPCIAYSLFKTAFGYHAMTPRFFN